MHVRQGEKHILPGKKHCCNCRLSSKTCLAIMAACCRRPSSMVEHSFRKAEVEGSIPSVGFLHTLK